MTVDGEGLAAIGEECVKLVGTEFGRSLDWTPESLDVLDEVCTQLRDGRPLVGERLDLWWKLVGSYLGEVVVRAYGGEWVAHEQAEGAYAVRVTGLTGFPFSTAARVLAEEYGKSLASFARSIPVVAERAQTDSPGDLGYE